MTSRTLTHGQDANASEAVKKSPAREVAAGLARRISSVFRIAVAG
jgi:hypothetical protein